MIVLAALTLAAGCDLAVFDLEAGEGVDRRRADALGELVVAGIAEAAPECHVVAKAELRAMVNAETERQAMGCDGDTCLAELGEALGVNRAVMGSVSVVDGATVLSLRLVDFEHARIEGRASDATRGDTVAFSRWLARKLMAPRDAGPRPAEPPPTDAPASVWRTLAWSGVGVGGGLLAVSGALGGATVATAAVSTSMKSSRGTLARDVDAVDAAGPWLAGGSNLALYLGAGLVVVGGGLFFLPATEHNEAQR